MVANLKRQKTTGHQKITAPPPRKKGQKGQTDAAEIARLKAKYKAATGKRFRRKKGSTETPLTILRAWDKNVATPEDKAAEPKQLKSPSSTTTTSTTTSRVPPATGVANQTFVPMLAPRVLVNYQQQQHNQQFIQPQKGTKHSVCLYNNTSSNVYFPVHFPRNVRQAAQQEKRTSLAQIPVPPLS
jgi:hypothetical protein